MNLKVVLVALTSKKTLNKPLCTDGLSSIFTVMMRNCSAKIERFNILTITTPLYCVNLIAVHVHCNHARPYAYSY